MAPLVGSLLTGATSVLTGNDSVLTAAGECPPAPGLFITDGASRPTGQLATVLTAGNADACGPQPPPTPGIVYWFEPDRLVTTQGANFAERWGDLTVNHFDQIAQDKNAAPTPDINRPVFVPNACPSGWPAFDWGNYEVTPDSKWLMTIGGANPNVPTAPGAARTVICLCKPANMIGGRLVGFRLNAPGFVLACWYIVSAFYLRQTWMAEDFEADANYMAVGSPIPPFQGTPAPGLDFTDTWVILSWEILANGQANAYFRLAGDAVSTLLGTYIWNTQANDPKIHPDSGVSGFTLGYSDIDAGKSFSGLLAAQLCYLGVDTTLRHAWEDYIAAKGGLL